MSWGGVDERLLGGPTGRSCGCRDAKGAAEMVKMIEGSGKNKIVQHAHTCSPHEDPYDAKGKNPKR